MKTYAKIENEKIVYITENPTEEFIKEENLQFVDVEKGYDGRWYFEGEAPARPAAEIAKDYDAALEAHIKAARMERGYTDREPSDYKYSTVPRWAQDAEDFIKFRDACMLYGLQVENDCAAGKEVPTLEEFKANLPQIKWTYTEE